MWCWPPPGEMSCTIKCVFVWHTSCCYQVRTAQRNHYTAYFSYANDFAWIGPSSLLLYIFPSCPPFPVACPPVPLSKP